MSARDVSAVLGDLQAALMVARSLPQREGGDDLAPWVEEMVQANTEFAERLVGALSDPKTCDDKGLRSRALAQLGYHMRSGRVLALLSQEAGMAVRGRLNDHITSLMDEWMGADV